MKKGKIIVSILTILILFTCASGLYVATNNIDETKIETKIGYSESLFDSEILSKIVYVLSDTLIKDNNTTPYERFAQSNIQLSEDDKKTFNSIFNGWYDVLVNEPNVKYQMIDTQNQKSLNNTNVDLFSKIKDDNYQNEFQMMIKIDFDENGNPIFSVPISNLIKRERKEEAFLSSFDRFKEYAFYDYFYVNEEDYGDASLGNSIEVTLKNPTHVSMVLAIPTKMATHGYLYNRVLENNGNHFLDSLIPIMLLTIAIVILFTLFTPIKYFKEMAVFKNLMRIKLGFFLITGIGIGVCLGLSMIPIMKLIHSGEMIEWLNTTSWSMIADLLVFLLVVGVWMLFLFLIMFAVYVIKYIFDKGLRKFIKENTIIGWLYLNFRMITDKIVNFDLDDPTNKAVLKIVAFNFLIITIISFFFVFGFFFTFVYSILLFVILRNKLNDIKYDYEVLLRATRKISNGEFDVEIKEDLGVFNSLKDEFSNIKDGFEKAVNEEVKSQRMKTELISNVSHDLKTPLTSIITYVDLLKNTDLSEEQREEYMATIERNSLRLKNLIDDLFEVSKVNSGNVKLNLIDVDIVSLIKQAYFENMDRMKEKKLDFKMNFSDEKIVYTLDSSKTYRIFENLLVNIGKYALANTRVYIDVSNYDNKVVITFKNISESEISIDESELMERFVQGDASRNTGGSGLGLAIAKSFTELQGGTFKVEVDGDLFKAIVTLKK